MVLNSKTFFEEKVVSQKFFIARTPQQNGVAKKRNRTLIEAARTMLSEASLPLYFWGEAVNTACFTHNRSLIVKRFGKTAYELIHDRKPNIGFLHVFGCVCYILNNKDHMGKFDPRADQGIFVGYSLLSKAFRVYNRRLQQVEEIINVKFDEISTAQPVTTPYSSGVLKPKERKSSQDNGVLRPTENIAL